MADPGREQVRQWLAGQVKEYRKKKYPRYKRCAEVLAEVLQLAGRELAPLAIVQTREKSVASFAEKALRKMHKYSDPVNQLTDLCGGRVIARTRSEVDAYCEYIKSHFEIDWDNSLDTSQRLKPSEFGYRSIHYIIKFRDDVDYGTKIPKEVFCLKAEVQVRTLVEHAYADFGHDLTYKGAFPLPTAWQRELASVAAALEEVDQTFSRIEDRLREYTTSYGKYFSEEERQREIDRLEIILEHVPDDAGLAAQLGKLAMFQEDWDKAEEALEPFVDPKEPEKAPQPILRDLGVTYCKKYPPGTKKHALGQRYLEIASAPEHADVDAICSLAGTWKGIDEKKAHHYYRRAFQTDPCDAYALENYLEYELEHGSPVLETARPLIQKAAERCEAHIAAGINLPWALYSLGKLRLLLGEPFQSLDAYAKAIQLSPAEWMIKTALRSLNRIGAAGREPDGFEWIRRLLTLGLAVHFDSTDAMEDLSQLATADGPSFRLPVRIVAGGTDPRVQAQIGEYSGLLMEGLAGFDGTIISGATTEGICGLVGDAAQRYGDRIHTVGYIPGAGFGEGTDATIDKDPERYRELRYTDGRGFTPLESLQNWIDLVVSGVPVGEVRVVGINGGRIAGAEYRIALALGAVVGVISESGREAGRILTDEQWSSVERLIALPRDAQTVRAFFGSKTFKMEKRDCETLAQAIHEKFLASKAESQRPTGRAIMPWEELDEDFKESNRAQARHIEEKLREIGCAVVSAEEAAEPVTFTPDEVELLAEMEHGRYNAERLLEGWRWSEVKDDDRKTSPYLVSWAELPDDIREYDRQTVREIPEFLARIGLAVKKRK
ncbi:MAG: RyR domain-containing protein [Gemmatimonadales bacterium]|jgi:ppGpp synthetase/RelA/SpoT-type nucleotidyltranferase